MLNACAMPTYRGEDVQATDTHNQIFLSCGKSVDLVLVAFATTLGLNQEFQSPNTPVPWYYHQSELIDHCHCCHQDLFVCFFGGGGGTLTV